MPRKGPRSITIDGDDFHWVVQDWGYIVVQHASGRGACLHVVALAIMLPKHVGEAIQFGIRHEWKPGQSGDSVWLGFDLLNDVAEFRLIPPQSQPTYDRELQCWVLPDPDDGPTG